MNKALEILSEKSIKKISGKNIKSIGKIWWTFGDEWDLNDISSSFNMIKEWIWLGLQHLGKSIFKRLQALDKQKVLIKIFSQVGVSSI